MKLTLKNSHRTCPKRGSVVLVLLIFLTLMGMLCAATWSAVHLARQEVALIEKHQVERLAASVNAPAPSTKPPSTP